MLLNGVPCNRQRGNKLKHSTEYSLHIFNASVNHHSEVLVLLVDVVLLVAGGCLASTTTSISPMLVLLLVLHQTSDSSY